MPLLYLFPPCVNNSIGEEDKEGEEEEEGEGGRGGGGGRKMRQVKGREKRRERRGEREKRERSEQQSIVQKQSRVDLCKLADHQRGSHRGIQP